MLSVMIFILLYKINNTAVVSSETFRTTSSVDIQVCAPAVLSSERDSVMESVQAHLKNTLASTAVYSVRVYTTAEKGSVCFLFVFQAPSPSSARAAVPLLVGNSGQINVQYESAYVACTITAVPWTGIENSLGLPWAWTGQDILLWGTCTGVLLLVCVIGVCCYVQLALSKERKRAQAILDEDRSLLSSLESAKRKTKK